LWRYREAVGIFRRLGPPRRLVAALGLNRGEHVIAWAQAAQGSSLVATDRALHATGPQGGLRLEWHQIAEATWRESVLRVVVSRAQPGQPPGIHTWLLQRPGLLPAAVRDRVTASIVVNRHVRLVGRSGVRILGRRAPGVDELIWTLLFDPDLDPTDPTLRTLADAELADLRQQLGA
jgi:hypothetical protein